MGNAGCPGTVPQKKSVRGYMIATSSRPKAILVTCHWWGSFKPDEITTPLSQQRWGGTQDSLGAPCKAGEASCSQGFYQSHKLYFTVSLLINLRGIKLTSFSNRKWGNLEHQTMPLPISNFLGKASHFLKEGEFRTEIWSFMVFGEGYILWPQQ